MKHEQTKEDLIKRQDEIYSQLEKTNKDLEVELDRDLEDQAIQVEQEEVAITMESNLRKELAEIEEKLAELGE